MKKLTEQEVAALANTFAVSRGRVDPQREQIRQEVLKLKIGEALQITTEDWPGKTHPSNNLSRLTQSANITLKIRALADKSGWVIQRIS